MKFWYRYVLINAVRRWSETLVMWVVWHLVPYEVRKWSVVRAFADATTTPPGDTLTPDQVGYSLVMKAMR